MLDDWLTPGGGGSYTPATPVAPVPVPVPAPAPAPTRSQTAMGLILAAVIGVGGFGTGYYAGSRTTPNPAPPPSPSPAPAPAPAPVPAGVDGAALGRAYAPHLASTEASGWLAAAADLENGKSVADAQKDLVTTRQQARSQAFSNIVAPSLAKVLPEGADPDPAQRAAAVALWRAFARGLTGGR